MIVGIVIMGGSHSGGLDLDPGFSTEILDVNSMTWTTGPALPIKVSGNKGVQSEVGPYLGFSTGGYSYSQFLNKIYGLKKTNGNSFEWQEVEMSRRHGMRTARTSHSVVNAPKRLLSNC